MYVGEACCMLLPIFDINYKFGHVNIHVLSSIRIHMLYCPLKLCALLHRLGLQYVFYKKTSLTLVGLLPFGLTRKQWIMQRKARR
jgi:hypothetical protein